MPDRTLRRTERPDGTVEKEYAAVDNSAVGWMKAHTSDLFAGFMVLLVVGWLNINYVSNEAYAEDQKAMITALQETGTNLLIFLHKDQIQEVDDEINELEMYIRVDDSNPLNPARELRIGP